MRCRPCGAGLCACDIYRIGIADINRYDKILLLGPGFMSRGRTRKLFTALAEFFDERFFQRFGSFSCRGFYCFRGLFLLCLLSN